MSWIAYHAACAITKPLTVEPAFLLVISRQRSFRNSDCAVPDDGRSRTAWLHVQWLQQLYELTPFSVVKIGLCYFKVFYTENALMYLETVRTQQDFADLSTFFQDFEIADHQWLPKQQSTAVFDSIRYQHVNRSVDHCNLPQCSRLFDWSELIVWYTV
jgi:hypothetical protein